MQRLTLLLLIFAGLSCCRENRQSEYKDFREAKRKTIFRTLLSTIKLYSAGEHPIKEHLLPSFSKAESPKWRSEQEELPNTYENRRLRWSEDFPLGTIQQKFDAPTAVVVPAKDATLQVARHGPHVFVTDDEVSDSPLKFIPHHHPSLRTVDLNELADEVNMIFAHPRSDKMSHHQIPETVLVLAEDNPVARLLMDLQKEHENVDFEDERTRSAFLDLPEGLENKNTNPFETTVLILPDDSPVKQQLKELQEKMMQKKRQNQTQIQTNEEQTQVQGQTGVEGEARNNSDARSATFSTFGGHGLVVPSHQQFIGQPTTSLITHQPVLVQPVQPGFGQFSQQGFRPLFREADEEPTAKSEQTVNENVGDSRAAKPHHLKNLLNKKFGAKIVPQNVIHIHQQQSSNAYGYQNHGSQYQRVGAPFLIDVPIRQEEFHKRVARSPTFTNLFQRPATSSLVFQQQPALVNRPVVFPQSFGQQSTGFGSAVVPANSFFRNNENEDHASTLLRSNGMDSFDQQPQQPSFSLVVGSPNHNFRSSNMATTEQEKERVGWAQQFFRGNQEIVGSAPENVQEAQQPSNQTVHKNDTTNEISLTDADIERIEKTVPFEFPKPGGYFPIIQATSPNGLPLQRPSDDPGYAELQRIRPINITVLEMHFHSRFNTTGNDGRTNDSLHPAPLHFPSQSAPIIHANSLDGKPIEKPSDHPHYDCITKLRGTNNRGSNQTVATNTSCTIDCATNSTDNTSGGDETSGSTRSSSLRFFAFPEDEEPTRSAADAEDFEDSVGPLRIFEFSNENGDDEISMKELEELFPGEARDADPTHHLHPHRGHSHQLSHFGQQVVVPPQHLIQAGLFDLLPSGVNAANLVHQTQLVNQRLQSSGQVANVQGVSNSVSQSQSQNHFNAGQNVLVNGQANSVSQGQVVSQNAMNYGQNLHPQGGFVHGFAPIALRAGQNVHIDGKGNSVLAASQNTQSSSVSGVSNAVSQSQSGSNVFHAGQTAQILGGGNGASQSQAASQSYHRIRRSLAELVGDPNLKLDVPKTIANIGAVTRASFHDQKKPMYHINNMGLIIPSQYKIINAVDIPDNKLGTKHEMIRSINEDLLPKDGDTPNINEEQQNSDPIQDTFNKFGTAIRESIRAGQQTLAHVGDIAHSARQVVHTAKSTSPKVFYPKNSRDKVMLMTPKILDIKSAEEGGAHLLQAQNREDFVKMGDMMDALGISNPNEENLGFEKIIIERKGGKRKPVIVGRSRESEEATLKDFVSKMKGEFDTLVKDKLKQERQDRRLRKTMKKLEKQGETVRAPLVKMTQQPSKFESVLGKVQDHMDLMKTKSDQVIDAIQNVNGKFIDTFRTIGGSRTTPKDDVVGVTHIIIPKNFMTTPRPTARLKSTNDESDYWDRQVSSFLTELFEEKKPDAQDEDIVGAPQISRNGLNLRPDLMKPFMGRASKASLRKFLKAHGNRVEMDDDDDEVVGAAAPQNNSVSETDMEKIRQAQKVLGAINPMMFEKLFNETMSGTSGRSKTPYEVFTAGRNSSTEERVCADKAKVGTSMKITKELLKPFMGRLKGNEYMEVIPLRNNVGGGVDDEEEEQQQYYIET